MRAVLSAVAGVVMVSPAAAAQEAPWPTHGWTVSNPSAEGLSEESLRELDRRIRDGGFGYVDRVVVVRHGRLVVNERYDQDYRRISRGKTSQKRTFEILADHGAPPHRRDDLPDERRFGSPLTNAYGVPKY